MSNHLPTLIFSHGNSFPASTYRALFGELRRRGFKVKAVEKYGHDERYPVTNNWPHLVQQLAETDKTGAPPRAGLRRAADRFAHPGRLAWPRRRRSSAPSRPAR